MNSKLAILCCFILSLYANCRVDVIRENSSTSQYPKIKIVFSQAGLRLREQPDLQSKNLITIPYASELEVIREMDQNETIEKIKGKWVEVKWKEKTGFVFDGYLLNKQEFIQFEKVFQYVKKRLIEISPKQKSEKYRMYNEWSPSQVLFIKKASNMNFVIYTFAPFKNLNGDSGCNYYGFSNCVNVIASKDGKIIFTDLDFESMGELNYLDEEIVRFNYFMGEGDGCNGFDMTTSFIYLFTSKFFLKRIFSISDSCVSSPCDNLLDACSKWEQTVRDNYFSPKNKPIKPPAEIKEYFIRGKKP